MRKKLLAMAMSSMLIGSLFTGCGAGGSTGSGEKKDDGKYRVAYVARAQTDSFAAWLVNEMKLAAEKYDDISLDILDGQGDNEKENAAIENAITNKYDAIIVQINNVEAQRPYVEKIRDSGIIAIATNGWDESTEGISAVDADPYNQGAVNAKLALEQVPQNAKVVVLDGPSGHYHSEKRREAWQKEFFDKRPDVEILGEQFANWNKDEAVQYMEDWVTSHGKIDAVISMNDNMAAGALEVVLGKEAYKDILSYGVDGTAEACLLIEEGKMTATCLQSAIALAELNMETVHKLLVGEEKQIETNIEEVLITKENASEYVKMYRDRKLLDN